jgi:hypothetical protein
MLPPPPPPSRTSELLPFALAQVSETLSLIRLSSEDKARWKARSAALAQQRLFVGLKDTAAAAAALAASLPSAAQELAAEEVRAGRGVNVGHGRRVRAAFAGCVCRVHCPPPPPPRVERVGRWSAPVRGRPNASCQLIKPLVCTSLVWVCHPASRHPSPASPGALSRQLGWPARGCATSPRRLIPPARHLPFPTHTPSLPSFLFPRLCCESAGKTAAMRASGVAGCPCRVPCQSSCLRPITWCFALVAVHPPPGTPLRVACPHLPAAVVGGGGRTAGPGQ